MAPSRPGILASEHKIANFPINRATREFRGAESGVQAVRSLGRGSAAGNWTLSKSHRGSENMVAESRRLGRWTLFENGDFRMKPERNIF
jgi:hypothetical protein